MYINIHVFITFHASNFLHCQPTFRQNLYLLGRIIMYIFFEVGRYLASYFLDDDDSILEPGSFIPLSFFHSLIYIIIVIQIVFFFISYFFVSLRWRSFVFRSFNVRPKRDAFLYILCDENDMIFLWMETRLKSQIRGGGTLRNKLKWLHNF